MRPGLHAGWFLHGDGAAILFEVEGKYGKARVFSVNRDEKAIGQIQVLMDQPFVAGAKVRIMPDYHWGAGCTIGFTAKLGKYVVPNLVGVDIGCGIFVQSLGKVEPDLKAFDQTVHQIPSGFNSWRSPWVKAEFMQKLKAYRAIKTEVIDRQVGTLGGGNHFIELGKESETGEVFLVIHSGSRNIGKQVADHYQKLAAKHCKEDVPKPLKYLTGAIAEDYFHDMQLCQEYAALNRATMAKVIGESFELIGQPIQTVHNYIDRKDQIVRKGAVSARKGERLIIPMNMRDGSVICTGKGNPDWNWSAPHGAGRVLGRMEAKRTLRMDEFKHSMAGVYSSSINSHTLDEAPMAYKPVDEILEAIGETVEVQAFLRPIYSFKAGKE